MEIVTVLFLLYQGQWKAIEEYETFLECDEALAYVITGYGEDGNSLEGFCQEFEKVTSLERIEII